MRHLLTFVVLFAPTAHLEAHCCRGIKHSCCLSHSHYYSAPPIYVAPYWAPPIFYVEPTWSYPIISSVPPVPQREVNPPIRKSTAEQSPPRIANPKLPMEDVEPKKVLPAPKKIVPKKIDEAKPVEKAVSVDEFLIPAEKKRSEPPTEVKIGIFNHSDRDMDLVINGEAVRLPAAQYVTLRMPRTFTWAIKGKPEKEVKVPADSDGLEIVFRR